jgi:phosphoribosyl 1,2-cyclic phosphodiesterase
MANLAKVTFSVRVATEGLALGTGERGNVMVVATTTEDCAGCHNHDKRCRSGGQLPLAAAVTAARTASSTFSSGTLPSMRSPFT